MSALCIYCPCTKMQKLLQPSLRYVGYIYILKKKIIFMPTVFR